MLSLPPNTICWVILTLNFCGWLNFSQLTPVWAVTNASLILVTQIVGPLQRAPMSRPLTHLLSWQHEWSVKNMYAKRRTRLTAWVVLGTKLSCAGKTSSYLTKWRALRISTTSSSCITMWSYIQYRSTWVPYSTHTFIGEYPGSKSLFAVSPQVFFVASASE